MEKRIKDLFNEEILEKAALLYGSTLEGVKRVGGFENYIYEFSKGENIYILRLSHTYHRSKEEVESELDFVHFLAENNARVSVPIRSINHNLVETVKCSDGSSFLVSAYHKAKGVGVRKDIVTDKMIYNYGKTIGKFHQLTKKYKTSDGIKKRYNWDEDLLITEAKEYLSQDDMGIYNKLIELVEYINTFDKNEDNYGLIHTDIHFGNFFVENDELTVFDFDDTAYQWFISDIAIALFYLVAYIEDEKIRLEKADWFMKIFMKGYLEEYPLDKDSYMKINYFLKLREIILYIVIIRSCNLETDDWAKRYISMYRNRILNDVEFLDLDFTKYYTI